MKNASFLFLCCILVTIVLPIAVNLRQKQSENEHISHIDKIKVLNTQENIVIELPLEEYVWRVVANEIPSSFHKEAIKAMTIAVRTYVLYKIYSNSHKLNADMCTDFNHCTAFLLPGQEKKRFGVDYKVACNKLISLTSSTENQIITYNNEPILAVFHAISSGITEKSSDVWQTQLPYLINVDSSIDKKADGFLSNNVFKESELKMIFNTDSAPEFEVVGQTSAGGIKKINVSGEIYSGNEIRKLLNLRSSNFTIKRENDTYTFYVKGYGHGVGMSQEGANLLANEGYSYREILQKYYPGTKINNFSIPLNATK